MNNFPFYKQPDAKDCGPTCLRIIAKHQGKLIPLQEIRELHSKNEPFLLNEFTTIGTK